MAKTPEGRYIDKVHRQIDKNIWKIRMQMGMGSPRGIPDFLYRGHIRDLWIEYKYVQDWTRKHTIPWRQISEHQMDWLIRGEELNRAGEHAVVFGDENGKAIWVWATDVINDEFRNEAKPSDFILMAPKEIVLKINSVIHAVVN